MKKKFLFAVAFSAIPMLLTACGGGSGGASTDNPLYTLILNPCAGDETSYRYVTGHTGDKVNLKDYVPTVSKSGYTFTAWSTAYSQNTKMGTADAAVTDGTYTFGKDNKVLYAYYKKKSVDPGDMSDAVKKYMEELKTTSEANHLYYHYYRFVNTPASYAPWDVWAWAYKPDSGEGAKFDWDGRTQSTDKMSATGDAKIGKFGGAYVDIDLKADYTGGWDNVNKVILNTPVSFATAKEVGLQIVQTETRKSGSGFWTNDGSNLYISLDDYALDLVGGGTAYHVFVVQDNIQDPSKYPFEDVDDPFANDDGTNTTYGTSKYDNVDWSKSASTGLETSDVFKEIGAGYQIMVSSFADSDGDGFGDIYGITGKLDYLEKLGVEALWLTPIQLSDSYHGYDITDYEKVDPKFGSTKSPAAQANGGVVTSETALEDYKELIKKAHEKKMKVVMDLVLNHTSTSNKWFVSSANLKDEYRGYYQWGNHNKQSSAINQDNNWYPYGDHPYSYYAKFGSSMPELNFSYKTTREAVEDMSVYWAKDIGVDGFRLDAVKHIYMENEVSSTAGDTIVYDKSDSGDYSSDLTKNIHFFKELKSTVTSKSGKNVFFVGENFDGHAYHVAPYYEAFDSLFDFYTYFNLTSAAATGRKNTTSAYGTASGFLWNNSPYTISADNDPKVGVKDNGNMFVKANNSAWNYPAVYNTYNKYRPGGVSLPGSFTSNHDIARTINRIAGSGALTGLNKQGNVTPNNFADFNKSAMAVKLAEILFPGVTWIYYGDEIGMTGNFPETTYTNKEKQVVPYDANAPYADLWYRQPMKWVANGVKGDTAGTTDYYVTGSAMQVVQDEVNKSSAVVPALTQAENQNSDFAIMAKFIKLKNGDDSTGKALRIGSFTAENYANGAMAANVLCFSRKINDYTLKIAINFNSEPVNGNSLGGTVIAQYNNPSNNTSVLPAYSVTVTK